MNGISFKLKILLLLFLYFAPLSSETEVPFTQLLSPSYDGQEVSVWGFLYQSNEGGWVLASRPQMKSCCIGKKNQIALLPPFSGIQTNQAVQVKGIFRIDPQELSQFYTLEQASLLTVGSETPIKAILALAAILLVLLVLFILWQKNLQKR